VNKATKVKLRFWRQVDRLDSGCWLWTGSKNVDGYGHLRIGGKLVKAHRFSWEIIKGEIPREYELWHLCFDNACVNPSHLVLQEIHSSAYNRIQRKLKKSNGCWEWLGPTTDGYGFVRVEGRKVWVHRVLYEVENKRILGSRQAKRTCGNPACVRPSHMKVKGAFKLERSGRHWSEAPLSGERRTGSRETCR